MMDTLAVALRVAEEAIEEAISKAEAYGDSLVRPPFSSWGRHGAGCQPPEESAGCQETNVTIAILDQSGAQPPPSFMVRMPEK